MVDIKKLRVSTNDEREGWIQLLKTAEAYHWDMSGEFQPTIKGDTDMEKVATTHRAWATSIGDAIKLIEMWEIEEEDDIKSVDG